MLRKVFTVLERFKLYLSNMSWMVGERFGTLLISFVVSAVVARYLGPSQFGILSYALSLVAIFASAGQMGLNGLVVRELVREPSKSGEIIATTFTLKMAGMILAFLAIIIYAIIFELQEPRTFWILLIISSTILFRPFDVIDFWFQSKVKAKYTTIARVSSTLITALFRITLVLLAANLLMFAYANILQTILSSLIMLFLFKKISKISFSTLSVNLNRAKQLVKQGWIIYLGSIFGIINIKIDQVMIKWYAGAEALGVYSVAALISEAWYFIPTAIVASVFPKLITLHKNDTPVFKKRMQQIFDVLFMLALLAAIVITILAKPLISMIYGPEYIDAANILAIHTWAAIFVFMRTLFSRWILVENALIFSLITQGLGAVTNVVLNIFLIPRYGGEGAAYATLASYAMSAYFSLLVYKKTRPIFWMMTKSLVSPIRYVAMGIKK